MNSVSDIDLKIAIRDGDLGTVRRALENGRRPLNFDEGGKTPLEWAVMYEQPKIVDLLLRSGARVEADCESGTSLLHGAALDYGSPCLPVLLAHGADPFAKDEEGKTPLCGAAASGSENNVRQLLEAQEAARPISADVVPRLPNLFREDDALEPYPEAVAEAIAFRTFNDMDSSESAEREEAWRCVMRIARYQLSRVNPTVRIGNAETLLVNRVCHGTPDQVAEALEQVQTVNYMDHNVGWSLLVCAIDRGSQPIVEALLTAGADRDYFGHPRWADTPIGYADREGHPEIAARLRR